MVGLSGAGHHVLEAGERGGFTDYWEKVAVDPAPRGRKRAKILF